MLKPGENLFIAKTANGFMVTGTSDGKKTDVSDSYVFLRVSDAYNSPDTLSGFIRKHFESAEREMGEEAEA